LTTYKRSETKAVRRKGLKCADIQLVTLTDVTEVYRRNPDVVAEVLYRVNGVWELCLKNAPFKRSKDGSPYLEVHHTIQPAHGGEDTIENALSLRPNCHREQHFLYRNLIGETSMPYVLTKKDPAEFNYNGGRYEKKIALGSGVPSYWLNGNNGYGIWHITVENAGEGISNQYTFHVTPAGGSKVFYTGTLDHLGHLAVVCKYEKGNGASNADRDMMNEIAVHLIEVTEVTNEDVEAKKLAAIANTTIDVADKVARGKYVPPSLR